MTNLATIVRDAQADHSGRTVVRTGDHELQAFAKERVAA